MQLSKHNLHIRFSAPLWRSVKAFWSWWILELSGMLPLSVRHVLMPRAQRLFLELDGTDLVMSQSTAQNRQELTRYPLAQADVEAVKLFPADQMYEHARELVLCLPPDKVLTKSLTLPLAAEENLREVLSFEMDRQTPFTADQVYYDFSVAGRSASERTLTVDLVLATRPMLDVLLARLDKFGLHPDLVTINCGAGDGFASVNLLPAANRQHKAITPRLVNFALGMLALLLMVSALSLPLLNKRHQIQTLESLLDSVSAKADKAHRLRKQVDQLTANARFLTDKKQSSLAVLQIMDELTRILPDDTWITHLDIRGSEVQIQGQSSSAAALIPLIESSTLLQNPRFRSPVTQVARSDSERFHLSAETRGTKP